MMRVLVVGAGLAGCTTARELAENGVRVTLAEAADSIGGKVIQYGCKATDKCNNCGLCLTASLWEQVEQNKNIDIRLKTKLIDLMQEGDRYIAALQSADGTITSEQFDKVVVSTGFAPSSLETYNGFVELHESAGILTGSRIEELCAERTGAGLFETPPERVAFIQCYGSRDQKEHAMYCSRVCCSYATRAAKVIKYFYPECRVVFFYMELQMVNRGDYYQSLLDAGIEFVKCRPIQVTGGKPAGVSYDDPATGKRMTEFFDWVVLSDGIRPDVAQARKISELCGLQQDAAGFLHHVNSDKPDVRVTGCAAGPKKIAETYMESLAVARGLLL